ncbi:MAG: 2Fe-2S iron-sulfur cluster binding domain-containing protein [Chitinophagaceae bacterium]|nr:2Fe-2S iron-sulfur cluster binding domain-containing protein [Chitinophagaceae bacterium]
MYRIKYQFEEKGKEAITIENAEDGFSILEIALKNKIEIHHNCGGVCACSTCHVYINKGSQFIEELSDKEEDFIDRAKNPRIESRLSCQCELLKGEGEIVITVPDQTLIQGE